MIPLRPYKPERLKTTGRPYACDADRLMAYVKENPETGCWEWTGAKCTRKTKFQYGTTHTGYKNKNEQTFTTIKSHRLSYLTFVGPIPDGLCVLHRCDNPPCINPNHLFLGTNKDNVDDKMSKGRHRPATQGSGEKAWRAKLTNEQVAAIRASPLKHQTLADIYGVSRTQISAYKRGEYYKSAQPLPPIDPRGGVHSTGDDPPIWKAA